MTQEAAKKERVAKVIEVLNKVGAWNCMPCIST